MALTEERIDLPTPSISDVVSEPDEATATAGWAWALVVLGVAMAIVLAVVVLQAADGADTDAGVGNQHLLVENGSPRAIDAASISGPHDHALVVRYGSITAIDHAAEASGS